MRHTFRLSFSAGALLALLLQAPSQQGLTGLLLIPMAPLLAQLAGQQERAQTR